MSIILTDHRGHPADTSPAPVRRANGRGIGLAQSSPVRVSVDPPNRFENKRLTGTAWRDVVLKCAGMYLNVPYVDGAVGSVADYLGPVTPSPDTADTDYNDIVTEWLRHTLLHGYDFDATGTYTFAELQKEMWKLHDVEGDILAIDTFEEEGNPASRPIVRIIPALGIDNPLPFDPTQWQDGVQVGRHHRALAYHILAEESQLTSRYVANRAGYVIPREKCFHFRNASGIGSTRGRSRFLTSGNTVIDLAMMDSATHRLFDLAAKFGITFTAQTGQAPSVWKTLDGTLETETLPTAVNDADGNPINVEAVREKLNAGSVILDLTENPGQEMKIANVGNALPDTAAVRASDLERIAMSYRLPVQILFCIMSGVFNLTGPGFRMSLTRAKRWREEHLAKIEPWVRRQYTRHINWGLATGQIPYPKKSVLRPYSCRTRWARDIGIDEARDVNSDQIRLEIGATTEAEIASEYGRDIRDVIRERADFIRSVLAELKADSMYWGDNFNPSRAAPAAPAARATQPAAA